MLTFTNPGLIDLTAATTFGISVKESENPIGYFGTGLKYAIAIVLRGGGKFVLYRGLTRMEFTSEEREVRGQTVEVVCLDGDRLGFTTRMGINWQPWQAFRELYCNAKDEGGMCALGEIEPRADHTTIQIEGLDECWQQRHKIMLDDKATPVAVLEGINVYAGACSHVYMRGLRVADLPKPSAFTYDIQERLELTEDRTLKDEWSFKMLMARAICHSGDSTYLRTALSSGKDTFENELDLEWGHIKPGPAFLDIVGELRRQPDKEVSAGAINLFASHRPEPLKIETTEASDVERQQLEKALAFLELCGWTIDPGMIRMVASLGPSVLGRAEMGERLILISRKAFDMGSKYVAGTLLEEWLQITTNTPDGRPMQNLLLDKLMSLGERFIGEPL